MKIKKAKKSSNQTNKQNLINNKTNDSKINIDPKQKEPPVCDSQNLSDLFNQGRHNEALLLAQKMTKDFPNYGFGWMVLGAIFDELGRTREGLDAKMMAVKLLPNDSGVHYNLGNALKNTYKFSDAESAYLKAISIKNDFVQAYSNLAFTLNEQGRYSEAEKMAKKAILLQPDFVQAYLNLACSHKEQSKLVDAERQCIKAIELKPESAEAFNNLGAIFMEQKKLQEAEQACRSAIKLKPNYPEAYINLGLISETKGDMSEARIRYITSLQLKPDLPKAFRGLGLVYLFSHELDLAFDSFIKAFKLCPSYVIGLEAAAYAATISFIQDDLEKVYAILEETKDILTIKDKKFHNAKVYYGYLSDLISWRKLNPSHYYDVSFMSCEGKAPWQSLYVIGESHSLSSSALKITYNNHDYVCKSNIIIGCKEYHLGQTQSNKYKYNFEAIMKNIPNNSTVLLTIGEIDCRQDEGIFKVWKKKCNNDTRASEAASPSAAPAARNDRSVEERLRPRNDGSAQGHCEEQSDAAISHPLSLRAAGAAISDSSLDCHADIAMTLEQIINSTITNYINYISTFAKQGNHKFIISGVPAINSNLDSLTKQEALIFLDMVKTFNDMLKQEAISNNMDFLDVYSLTNRGDGISNGKWHLDTHHLYPSATKEAFDNYLVKS